MSKTRQLCEDYKNEFNEYSQLWTKELEDAFEEFLNDESKYPQIKEEDEEEGEADKEDDAAKEEENPIMKGIREKIPSIEAFDEEISYYLTLNNKIKNTGGSKDINWLKVQANPLKETLTEITKSWINKWTTYIYKIVCQK